MRPRQIAPVALVLVLTVAGFLGARLLGERDARLEAESSADVAAAQIHARVEQGASLADGLRRQMVGVAGRGITSQEFADHVSRWLSPAGFPAAAWVEEVPASQRAEYERRIGRPIATRDREGRTVPVDDRATYLPATLVSGIPPMAEPGIELGGEAGVAAALARASTLYDAGATPLTTLRDGTTGLFLVRLAPRLAGGVVERGFLIVFLSELWLRSAATTVDAATLKLAVGGRSDADGVRAAFTTAGQRFEVLVPQGAVHGAAAVLPWIILAAGLALAGLAAALAVNAARRARAQEELDRIFSLSPDVIVVADFNGIFKRVNPAAEDVLGYPREELLTRPFLEFVHPEDREQTVEQVASLQNGKATLSFENRYVRSDGSERALEWTATPVVEDGVVYGVARDVTERRAAEAELARLAAEQAALRRVATLVAKGVPAAEVFSAVAEEVVQLLDASGTMIARLEPDGTALVVANKGTPARESLVGTHMTLEPGMAVAQAVWTGRPARVEDDDDGPGLSGEMARRMKIRCAVAVPIMVEGSLWGSVIAGTERDHFPPDAEERMTAFTELAATAIANAESRSELTASRARVIAASDETRRQIERDLHDGAQQRLVHTVITLKMANEALQSGTGDAPALVAEALEQAEQANVELRELVQGILPPVLTRSGLRAAVRALPDRMPVPLEIDVEVERLDPSIEATAYFVIAEALTNVAKHARASHATVTARVEDGLLRIRVRDDGVGGARSDGHGFVGLRDRLAALEGQLRVDSPPGGGTLVAADIPVRH